MGTAGVIMWLLVVISTLAKSPWPSKHIGPLEKGTGSL